MVQAVEIQNKVARGMRRLLVVICLVTGSHDWRVGTSWGLSCQHEHTREVNRYKMICNRCGCLQVWRDAQFCEWFTKQRRGVSRA